MKKVLATLSVCLMLAGCGGDFGLARTHVNFSEAALISYQHILAAAL